MRSLLAAILLFFCHQAAAVAANPCVPNPNLVGPPFVNGCPLPAEALNGLGVGTASLIGGVPQAVCDNVTDDTAAINARLASGEANVYTGPKGKICYHATGIIIPDGVTLNWQTFSPENVQSSGLRCGLTSGICVTVGQGTNNFSGLNNVAIFGSGSSHSQTCVEYNGNNNITSENVYCQGFSKGYSVNGDGTFTGIYVHLTDLYSCNISDAHVVINQATGVYFTNPILGCDGAADVNGADYVRIVGNWDNVKGTLHFVDPHFNLGLNTVGCAFNFKSFTGVTNQFIDFSVLGGHIEAAQNFLCSDSSVGSIALFSINGNTSVGGNGTNHFFALNAATEPEYWAFNNNVAFSWGDYTLAPSAGPSVLTMVGNDFPGLLHITAASVGDAVIQANNYIAGATLDGAGWLTGTFDGTFLGGSATFSDSALQNVNVTLNAVSCSPALQIGGSSTGITYTGGTPICMGRMSNHYLTMSYEISVTSLGGLTGAATMIGLPFKSTAYGTPLMPMIYAHMAGLTGGVLAEVGVSSHSVLFATSGAADLTMLTNSNFGTCSGGTPCIIQGTVTYPVGGN